MFIKKDLRKIPQILEDENDDRSSLKLFKRANEFEGNLSILGIESNIAAFSNLRVLNLYDNHLTAVEGIGNLEQTPIEEINLGCNDLTSLPLEFARVSSMRSLWLDDNNFEEFPLCLCQLTSLESLRFSGNKLSMENMPSSFCRLTSLTTLALDNNLIHEIPDVIWVIISLKHLWLRQNKISHISERVFQLVNLETLSLSSNRLESLPAAKSGWCNMVSLKKLYLNGNRISFLPESFAMMPTVEVVNVANNLLTSLPAPWAAFAEDKTRTISGTLHVPRSVGDDEMEVVAEVEGEVKITIMGNTELMATI